MERWRTSKSRIIFSRFFLVCQSGSEAAGASYIFVVNVNVNDDGLNANVNRFSNDNDWNGDNGHRFFCPQLTNFSFVHSREFSFPTPFSNRPAFGPPHLAFRIKRNI